MTRAHRLSAPSGTSDLEALSDRLFAAVVPADAQRLYFRSAISGLDLQGLTYAFEDTFGPWPDDDVAEQLAEWHEEIWADYQLVEVAA